MNKKSEIVIRSVGIKRKDVSTLTVLVLADAYSSVELSKMFNVSVTTINLIKNGRRSISSDDYIDENLIDSLGLKLCGCCGRRVVVEEPVSGVKLSTLCYRCFRKGSSGDEEHRVRLPKP